jgi:hypothetical protein
MASEIPTAKKLHEKKPQAAFHRKLTNNLQPLQSRPACGGITPDSRGGCSIVSFVRRCASRNREDASRWYF